MTVSRPRTLVWLAHKLGSVAHYKIRQPLIKRRKVNGQFAKNWTRPHTFIDKIFVGGVLLYVAVTVLTGEYKDAIEPHIYTAEAYDHPVEIEQPEEVLIRVETDYEKRVKKIQETFPDQPELAVAIGKSESGKNLNPNAYNPEWHYDSKGNKLCQGSYGLMQIGCVHHMSNPEALFDIDFNLQKAKSIYNSVDRHGRQLKWNPWGGYTSGGYKKYMK